VDVFAYDFLTGSLGSAPLLTIPISNTIPFFGMEQLAVHPDGSKVYVSQPGALNVYDVNDGSLLNSITHPSIVQPTGVCFRTQ